MKGGRNRDLPRLPQSPAALPAAAVSEILALINSGQWGLVEAKAREAAARHPGHPFGWKILGTVLLQSGRLPDARDALTRAAALAPQDPMIHNNLGSAFGQLGLPAEAEACFRRAVALKPDWADAQVNLGDAQGQLGQSGPAEASYRRAIALRPAWADAHLKLGNLLYHAGRLEEAEASCRQALALSPGNPEAHDNLGTVLRGLYRFEEAATSHRRAIALRPDFAAAYSNLGSVLHDLGEFEQAAENCRRALAIRPDYAAALDHLGSALCKLRRVEEGEACFRRAIAIDPGFAEAHKNLAGILLNLACPAEAAAEYEAALALRPDSPSYFNRLLSCALYRDDLSADDLAQLHRRYGKAFSRQFPPLATAMDASPRKLRIGYLSSDFRNHSVARNVLPVIRAHDRSAFEIHCYAHVLEPDAVTGEFRSLADGWHDIRALTDAQAARNIRADGIDILVSLAGRFDENRPQICAYRAAPVQISLHDGATSGLAEMDYVVADRWLIPGRGAEFFVERPLRLPNYYVGQFPKEAPALSEAVGTGGPVFACFNNPAKITPPALACWGRILAALPDARLRLKYLGSYQSESLRARTISGLTREGAGAGQVEFLTQSESLAAHLALYDGIDVALDTFPFSGSTTSFEALVMGVPVVTWPGERMVGSWTCGMLQALRMPDLIADSEDSYVAIAVKVAGERAAWRGRRREIRERLTSSCLCDGELWTRRIERLYRAAWRKRGGELGISAA